jgi:hypothetical protein
MGAGTLCVSHPGEAATVRYVDGPASQFRSPRAGSDGRTKPLATLHQLSESTRSCNLHEHRRAVGSIVFSARDRGCGGSLSRSGEHVLMST